MALNSKIQKWEQEPRECKNPYPQKVSKVSSIEESVHNFNIHANAYTIKILITKLQFYF